MHGRPIYWWWGGDDGVKELSTLICNLHNKFIYLHKCLSILKYLFSIRKKLVSQIPKHMHKVLIYAVKKII